MGMDIEGLDKLQEGLQKVVQKGVDELNKGLDRINNPEGTSETKVPTKCPNCNATLNIDTEDPVITCEYCGTKIKNVPNKSVVDSVFDFVEKQQQFASETIVKKAEVEAQRKVEREARKARRRAARLIRRIIFLIIVIVLAIFYINNREAIDAIIMPLITEFASKIQ